METMKLDFEDPYTQEESEDYSSAVLGQGGVGDYGSGQFAEAVQEEQREIKMSPIEQIDRIQAKKIGGSTLGMMFGRAA